MNQITREIYELLNNSIFIDVENKLEEAQKTYTVSQKLPTSNTSVFYSYNDIKTELPKQINNLKRAYEQGILDELSFKPYETLTFTYLNQIITSLKSFISVGNSQTITIDRESDIPLNILSRSLSFLIHQVIIPLNINTRIDTIKIENLGNEAEKFVASLKDMLTQVTQATLTSAFLTTKVELEKSMTGWLATTYITAILLLLVYAKLFLNIQIPFLPLPTDNQNINLNEITLSAVIAKTIITFPIIYLFVFASRTYSIQKRLYEEYSFKVVIASSLESYLKILDKVEKGNIDAKYRDFLIASIDKIFTSPNKLAFNHKSAKDDGEMNMSELQALISLIKDTDKTAK